MQNLHCLNPQTAYHSTEHKPVPELQFMRTILLIALIALVVLPARAQTMSTCRPSDVDAQRMLRSLRELVVSTQSDRVQLRNAFLLKAIDSTNVVLVTDNAVCAKVATGINTFLTTPNLFRHLYVVRVGNDFAAKDPGHPWGEWWPTITLDSQFRYKSSVLAP